MACACRGRKNAKFLWIPEGGSVDGENTKVYKTEVEAKAKVMRDGGTYYNEEQWAQMVMGRSRDKQLNP